MTDSTSKINKCALEQIDGIAKKCKEKRPLVVINCITYNHEPYIREALDGFLMQKANFPFVAVVHDDASTDGTAAIIREYAEKYPDIILPIYETENQYSKRDGSLSRIMQEARNATAAKYVAYCEGDDYWTAPLKLQKQVDFLESHPDYGIVSTGNDAFIQDENRFRIFPPCTVLDIQDINSLFELGITTLTVVLRRNILEDYYDEVQPERFNWAMGDYPIWLYFATRSKIYRLGEKTGIYRVLSNSASHHTNNRSRLRFGKSLFSILDYFTSNYGVSDKGYETAFSWISDQYSNVLAIDKDNEYLPGIIQHYKKKGKWGKIIFLKILYIVPECILSKLQIIKHYFINTNTRAFKSC